VAGDKPVNTGCAPEVRGVLDAADMAFTIVFSLDLAINLYSHWFRPFFTNGWSLLDLVVVTFSLVALDPSQNLPVNVVRTVRAFRDCRFFGKIGELKRIVHAISKSVIPVMNGEFPEFSYDNIQNHQHQANLTIFLLISFVRVMLLCSSLHSL